MEYCLLSGSSFSIPDCTSSTVPSLLILVSVSQDIPPVIFTILSSLFYPPDQSRSLWFRPFPRRNHRNHPHCRMLYTPECRLICHYKQPCRNGPFCCNQYWSMFQWAPLRCLQQAHRSFHSLLFPTGYLRLLLWFPFPVPSPDCP